MWSGWTSDCTAVELAEEWCPWDIALEERRAPYYEWFVGGRTSAAFNEMDRHVLAGHGDEDAFIGVDLSALEAVLGGGKLTEECSRLSRKERTCHDSLLLTTDY